MKFVVVAVLLCLSVCIVSSLKVNTFGRITNRTMGTRRIDVRATRYQTKNYTLTFPEVICFFFTFTYFWWSSSPENQDVTVKLQNTNNNFKWAKLIIFFSQGRSPHPIVGIQYLDYEVRPSSVRFLKGGLGQQNVTLFVQSQRDFGINSTFVFYTL